jgi:hypothetical protein
LLDCSTRQPPAGLAASGVLDQHDHLHHDDSSDRLRVQALSPDGAPAAISAAAPALESAAATDRPDLPAQSDFSSSESLPGSVSPVAIYLFSLSQFWASLVARLRGRKVQLGNISRIADAAAGPAGQPLARELGAFAAHHHGSWLIRHRRCAA